MAPHKKVDNTHSAFEGEWTLELIKTFIKTLMDVILCSDVFELKDHFIPDSAWKEVEQKIKIDSEILKDVWYCRLHMQLFCPKPIYCNDVKIKLIEYLYHKGITDIKDIRWNHVTSCLEGTTMKFLYGIFYNLTSLAKLKTHSEELSENIAYLYEQHIPHLIGNSEDKILPRLQLNDNNVEHIDTEFITKLEFN